MVFKCCFRKYIINWNPWPSKYPIPHSNIPNKTKQRANELHHKRLHLKGFNNRKPCDSSLFAISNQADQCVSVNFTHRDVPGDRTLRGFARFSRDRPRASADPVHGLPAGSVSPHGPRYPGNSAVGQRSRVGRRLRCAAGGSVPDTDRGEVAPGGCRPSKAFLFAWLEISMQFTIQRPNYNIKRGGNELSFPGNKEKEIKHSP